MSKMGRRRTKVLTRKIKLKNRRVIVAVTADGGWSFCFSKLTERHMFENTFLGLGNEACMAMVKCIFELNDDLMKMRLERDRRNGGAK